MVRSVSFTPPTNSTIAMTFPNLARRHSSANSPRWRDRSCCTNNLWRFLRRSALPLTFAPLALFSGCAEGTAHASGEPEQGLFNNEFLMPPFTVADAVRTHLRTEARRMADRDTGSLTRMASAFLIDEFAPHVSTQVRVQPNGQIVFSGSAGAARVNPDSFSSVQDRSMGTCIMLLETLVRGLVGPPVVSLDGQFAPVATYLRAMGTGVLRDEAAARDAARVLWANTRAEFHLHELAEDRTTSCSATTTPEGWDGDLAHWWR